MFGARTPEPLWERVTKRTALIEPSYQTLNDTEMAHIAVSSHLCSEESSRSLVLTKP